jgi:cytochrome c biogenesis protein CcmG/thiol:disulfide interchange protein DsbE
VSATRAPDLAGVAPAVPGAPSPVRSHRARWAALTVLVVAAGLVAVLATRPSAQVASVDSPLVGNQAPVISGTTVDGGHVSLPAAPGHYVVLNFFASWCVPCQQEGPALVAFAFQHRDGSAQLVSVRFNDTVGAVRRYQATLGATWPTLVDRSGRLALAYGVKGQPTTFVIAPDGRVVAYIVAPVTAHELDQVIARAEAAHA